MHCFRDSYSERAFVLSWIGEAGTNPALCLVGVGLSSWQEMPWLERQSYAPWLWATPCLSLVWSGVCVLRWWVAGSHGGACQIGWRVRSLCRCVSLCLNIGIFEVSCLLKDQGCPNSGSSQAKDLLSTGAKNSLLPSGKSLILCVSSVTGDVRVTSLPWKLLFSWPSPIWLLFSLFFMKKGWWVLFHLHISH